MSNSESKRTTTRMRLKDDEVDSLDEDGHSKHDPYAALARE